MSIAQVNGKITSTLDEALPGVNIFIEDTYIGTTTNNDGLYTLDITNKGNYTIVFQYLGFKTVKKNIDIDRFPFTLDMQLQDGSFDQTI